MSSLVAVPARVVNQDLTSKLSAMLTITAMQLLVAVPILWVLRAFYRLFLHPLAAVPGPRWAAITSMYGGWYDLPVGTDYTRKIMKLHEQYGPVVRAFPNQVHILDMKSYDEIFKTGSKFQRANHPIYSSPVLEGSMWNNREPNAARIQRGTYLPFFSRQSIQQLEPLIQKQMLKFFEILESKPSGTVVDITMGYKCMTADVIMEYCFKKSLGFLDVEDFQAPLIVALDDFFKDLPKSWYFPNFQALMFHAVGMLPEKTVKKFVPVMAGTQWIKKQCRDRVHELLEAEKAGTSEKGSHRSMLENAISVRPQTGEMRITEEDLAGDAYLFFGAGTDTTANTLAFGTWYLLNHDEARQRLKKELKDFISDPRSDKLKTWQELEKLPYLSAVIKESLRISFGAAHRQPRVAPDTDYTIHGLTIPKGTPISHTTPVYHLSETYFKDANSFIPERWLDASADLEHNMISFPRGPRSCIGQNLAYAELYLAFAYMFRRFEIENAGTTTKDMEWNDYFVPYTNAHLKVKLTPVSE